MHSICGIDCTKCELNSACKGCAATHGKPFGGECIVANCCRGKGHECCGKCSDTTCNLKKQLIAEFNALGIQDMEEITDLNGLLGSIVNLEYILPSGQKIKFWDDNKIYLGNQLPKKNSNRCYGLAADENYLLVCECDPNGSDAEIVSLKKRG